MRVFCPLPTFIHAAALRSRANLDFLLSGDAKSLEARNDRLMKQLASVVGQTTQSLTETRVFPLHQERCGTAKMDVRCAKLRVAKSIFTSTFFLGRMVLCP